MSRETALIIFSFLLVVYIVVTEILHILNIRRRKSLRDEFRSQIEMIQQTLADYDQRNAALIERTRKMIRLEQLRFQVGQTKACVENIAKRLFACATNYPDKEVDKFIIRDFDSRIYQNVEEYTNLIRHLPLTLARYAKVDIQDIFNTCPKGIPQAPNVNNIWNQSMAGRYNQWHAAHLKFIKNLEDTEIKIEKEIRELEEGLLK